ncbi:hypothetical protein [Clostridium sp. ZS2-4]|uniref:hypothetical protein n=1 Tax=Clostridium sp. ZS2-4 TaxID=2987703 RepID=UPI00227AD27D|nr:hypothetical protein [Clostridium sp. ZS2-4]MCY6355785.1 hypothetical protein [Clostridium sp. ZS2-4]
MTSFFKAFVPMLIMIIVILAVYNVLKAYLLESIKINKWIVLAVGLAVIIVPVIIWPDIQKTFWYYVQTSVSLILFLWFMDLAGWSKRPVSDNDKKTVIRSKAKPNRINKSKDMEVLEKKRKKKK